MPSRAPKMSTRGLQTPSRTPKTQDASRMPPDVLRRPKNASRTPPTAPKTPPKRLLNGSNPWFVIFPSSFRPPVSDMQAVQNSGIQEGSNSATQDFRNSG